MNPKTLIAAILAGQIANAALIPRVVTLHLTSTITSTVTPTSGAGSNPSNAALPSRFSSSSSPASTTVVTLSSFSDASPSHPTTTPSPAEKTKTVYKTVRVPHFITVKSECEVKTTTVQVTSTVTAEPIKSSSSTKSKWSYPLPEKSTAEPKHEASKSSAEVKPEETKFPSDKDCIYPMPGSGC